MSSEEEYQEIGFEQSELAFNFLNAVLHDDDIDKYWDFICEKDQSRIFGMYVIESEKVHLSFREYISKFIKAKHEKIYKDLKDNPGISATLRETKNNEFLIYMFRDVQVSRTYIAETEEYVYPIVITCELKRNGNEFTGVWKIRVYDDLDYKKLI